MNYFLKKYKTANIIIGIISVLAISCDKQAENVDLPEYKPKLVLHSFISPSDTILYAQVSTTKNVYGPVQETPKILPVKVSLVDGDNVIPFSGTDTSGVCSLQYQIFEGKTYGIIATCEGYPDVTGTCNVPTKGPIDIQIDTMTSYNKGFYNEWTVKEFDVSFNDIPNQNNFYKVFAFTRGDHYHYSDYYNNDNTYSTEYKLPSYPINKVDNIKENDCLLSDNLMDGNKLNFIFWMEMFDFDHQIYYIKIDVLGTDKDYYLYHTSIKKYNDGENPFVEFSPVYSNLKGGFGIFCSYVKYEKIMTFPENARP